MNAGKKHTAAFNMRYIYALDHCQTVLVYLLLLVVVVIRSPSELTIGSFVYGSIPYTSISCTPCCLLFVLSLKGRLRTLQILRVLQSTTNRKNFAGEYTAFKIRILTNIRHVSRKSLEFNGKYVSIQIRYHYIRILRAYIQPKVP